MIITKEIEIRINSRQVQYYTNLGYNIKNVENYNLYILYDFILKNDFNLILESYSNILQYNFNILDITEKKIFFKKGNYNFYDIDRIYLSPIKNFKNEACKINN